MVILGEISGNAWAKIGTWNILFRCMLVHLENMHLELSAKFQRRHYICFITYFFFKSFYDLRLQPLPDPVGWARWVKRIGTALQGCEWWGLKTFLSPWKRATCIFLRATHTLNPGIESEYLEHAVSDELVVLEAVHCRNPKKVIYDLVTSLRCAQHPLIVVRWALGREFVVKVAGWDKLALAFLSCDVGED